MTRDEETVRSVRIEASYKMGVAGERSFADIPGLLIPAKFQVTVDDDTVPFEVTFDVAIVDGQAEVGRVSLQRREGGPSINARSLREVPFQRFLEAGLLHVGFALRRNPAGSGSVGVPLADADDREVRAAAKAARRRQRRNAPGDVEDAWRLHQGAMQDEQQRRRATLYVAEQMNVSRATAARLLQRARAQHGGS